MSMVDPFPLLTFHDNNMFINCCCLITKGSRKMINHSIFHPFFKILGTVCCDWRIEAQKLTNMSTYWLVVSLSFLARNNPTWHIEPSWYFQHPPTPPPHPIPAKSDVHLLLTFPWCWQGASSGTDNIPVPNAVKVGAILDRMERAWQDAAHLSSCRWTHQKLGQISAEA